MTDLSLVLYVEDDPDIQTVAQMALEMVGGFTLRTCSSGSEALLVLSDEKFLPLSGAHYPEAIRSAVIAAPYMSGRQRVLGSIGVIGPARLNYARVIPLVDYTARVLGQMANK